MNKAEAVIERKFGNGFCFMVRWSGFSQELLETLIPVLSTLSSQTLQLK